jgi:hypothetical protein
MIDVDALLHVEYEDGTRHPAALIEYAADEGNNYKCATVLQNLAKRCNPLVEAYVVLYKRSTQPNPANREFPDIVGFRVKRLWPEPETDWHEMTPEEWAWALWEIRCRAEKPKKALPVSPEFFYLPA